MLRRAGWEKKKLIRTRCLFGCEQFILSFQFFFRSIFVSFATFAHFFDLFLVFDLFLFFPFVPFFNSFLFFSMPSHVIPCFPMISHAFSCLPMSSDVFSCHPMLNFRYKIPAKLQNEHACNVKLECTQSFDNFKVPSRKTVTYLMAKLLWNGSNEMWRTRARCDFHDAFYRIDLIIKMCVPKNCVCGFAERWWPYKNPLISISVGKKLTISGIGHKNDPYSLKIAFNIAIYGIVILTKLGHKITT